VLLMKIHFVLFFSMLLVFVYGCATTKGYSGSSSGPTATIVAHGVSFQSVNGIEVGTLSSGLEVLPGKNVIELTVNRSNYNSGTVAPEVFILVLNAEGGRRYSVTGPRTGGNNLCAYPLDSQGDPEFQSPAGCIQRQR
jgi:hypothetical protein